MRDDIHVLERKPGREKGGCPRRGKSGFFLPRQINTRTRKVEVARRKRGEQVVPDIMDGLAYFDYFFHCGPPHNGGGAESMGNEV
jgi:hypothetical protein